MSSTTTSTSEAVRSEHPAMIDNLRVQGTVSVVMLTGDNEGAASTG